MKKKNMEKILSEMSNEKLADKIRNETIVKVAFYGCMRF